jgi:hypothetical protein
VLVDERLELGVQLDLPAVGRSGGISGNSNV